MEWNQWGLVSACSQAVDRDAVCFAEPARPKGTDSKKGSFSGFVRARTQSRSSRRDLQSRILILEINVPRTRWIRRLRIRNCQLARREKINESRPQRRSRHLALTAAPRC